MTMCSHDVQPSLQLLELKNSHSVQNTEERMRLHWKLLNPNYDRIDSEHEVDKSLSDK